MIYIELFYQFRRTVPILILSIGFSAVQCRLGLLRLSSNVPAVANGQDRCRHVPLLQYLRRQFLGGSAFPRFQGLRGSTVAGQLVALEVEEFALVVDNAGMVRCDNRLLGGVDPEEEIPLGVHGNVPLGEIVIQHVGTLGLGEGGDRQSSTRTHGSRQRRLAQGSLDDVGTPAHQVDDGVGFFGHVLVEPSLGVDEFSGGVIVGVRPRSQLVGDNHKGTVPGLRQLVKLNFFIAIGPIGIGNESDRGEMTQKRGFSDC